MKFPNLVYAISLKRLPHYEIAQAAKISEWRFSRLLNGRSEATVAERERIATVLGFDQSWLFAQPRPPIRSTITAAMDGSVNDVARCECSQLPIQEGRDSASAAFQKRSKTRFYEPETR